MRESITFALATGCKIESYIAEEEYNFQLHAINLCYYADEEKNYHGFL